MPVPCPTAEGPGQPRAPTFGTRVWLPVQSPPVGTTPHTHSDTHALPPPGGLPEPLAPERLRKPPSRPLRAYTPALAAADRACPRAGQGQAPRSAWPGRAPSPTPAAAPVSPPLSHYSFRPDLTPERTSVTALHTHSQVLGICSAGPPRQQDTGSLACALWGRVCPPVAPCVPDARQRAAHNRPSTKACEEPGPRRGGKKVQRPRGSGTGRGGRH